MPPARGRNAIVGAFFIAAVALAVLVTAILSDFLSALTPTRSYVVRFELSHNAGLLAPGAEVRVGGMKVGSVADISLADEAGEKREEKIKRKRIGGFHENGT
eukprot:TRINITY_DN4405_c0_g2_i2.p4 TRINITY_DN4405_c0_g2~~TRINITY_DN4405_c0_g2_i2.p4  ORF type:complete len:102 (-),score=18.98 TRINITY_DN4405_c0_g2_i2:42-347(-)